jgi:hypothetical protein
MTTSKDGNHITRKEKKYHTVETVPKSNRKIAKRGTYTSSSSYLILKDSRKCF